MTNTTLSPMIALRLAVALLPAAAMAGAPIASSSFAGAEEFEDRHIEAIVRRQLLG